MNFIDLKRQYQAYKDEIDKAISEVVESCWFVLGEKVERLEHTLASFVGTRHAIGVGSGTDGLILGLMAKDVGPGDEIITTPFTFIATAEAISLVGARPLFVDIDPVTYNINVSILESVLTERLSAGASVKGIIPVGLYGQCADMDQINLLAKKHGLFVMEDACQSFGASYKGRMSCGLSDIGVTSFFPAKPLGAFGDGGMVFTDDPELAQRIRGLRVHGERERYDHREIGLNARLDALQAAVLLAKFPHFTEEIVARERVADTYAQLIRDMLPIVKAPETAPGRTHVYAQYTIRLPEGTRDNVCKSLAEKNIPFAIHYPKPLHLQPAFQHLGYGPGSFPEAERASQEVLSLPMHPFLTQDEQVQIISTIRKGLGLE